MPLYRYKCTTCGNEFRKILKKPTEMQPCPECGDIFGTYREKITSFSTRYKGDGFYSTRNETKEE